MTWEPITESEFRMLMAAQVLRLDAEMFPRWEACGVTPERLPCERRGARGGPPTREAVFVVARAGDEALIYDDVEEEFGAGTVEPDGVLRAWSTFGAELAWALRRFPARARPRDAAAPPA